jgi:hypothetical protein
VQITAPQPLVSQRMLLEIRRKNTRPVTADLLPIASRGKPRPEADVDEGEC